jgi:PKD repeat protein
MSLRATFAALVVASLVSTAPVVGAGVGSPAPTAASTDAPAATAATVGDGPLPYGPYGSNGTGTDAGGSGGAVSASATAENFDVAVNESYDDAEFVGVARSDGELLLVGGDGATATPVAVAVDRDGGEKWRRTYQPDGGALFYDAAPHPDGGYVVVGTSGSFETGRVLRLGEGGEVRWSRTYGEGGVGFLTTVAVREDGRILAGGLLDRQGTLLRLSAEGDRLGTVTPDGASFVRTVQPTGEPGEYLVSGDADDDALVARLDADDRAYEWTTTVGGEETDVGYSAAAADGGVYLVGFSESPAYGGASDSPTGLAVRLSPGGEVRWTESVGDSDDDRLYDVAAAPGGVVATGVAGENRRGTDPEADGLVVGLGPDEVRYVERVGGPGHQDLPRVVATDDGFATVGDRRPDPDTPDLVRGWFLRAETGGGDGGDGATTDVTVSLSSAPDGLQTFELTVAAGGATVESVVPGAVSGGGFQQVAGGPGEASVRVRGADLGGAVEPGAGETDLVTVTFDGDVSRSAANVAVHELVADDGDPVDRSRVTVTTGDLFASPVPGTGGEGPPTDPDGDGEYEDVDGDGEAAFDDAVALSFADTSGLRGPQRDALDFDGDGDVDFDDAVSLAFRV